MAIMAMGTVNKKALCWGLLVTSSSVFAGDWQVTPQVFIEENFTDNVSLVSNQEESSLVSQFGLNFDVNYLSQNSEFNFKSSNIYAMYSHDSDLNDDFLTLDTSGRFLLWPNGIALTASATVENQSRNRARNALADLVSGDTVQVENYSAGVEYRVDNSDFLVDFNTNYNLRATEDGIGERDGYSAQLLSYNGKAARNVFWHTNIGYSDIKNNDQDATQEKIELRLGWITPYKFNPFIRYYYEDNSGNIAGNNTYESNAYGVGFRWLAQPRLFVDVSYNKPEDDQFDIDGNEQKEYVNAEVNWQPTSRTQLVASYGERFFGKSYSLNIKHRNKRLTNDIKYSEEIESFTRNNYELLPQGAYWCPLEFVDITECYVQAGDDFNFDDYRLITLNDYEIIEDNSFTLNKVASWNSTLALARTTFTMTLNHRDKENLETRVSDRYATAGLLMSRKISGYSTLDLNVEYTEDNYNIDTDTERLDRYRRYTASYNRKLNRTLNAKLGLTHINRQSSEDSFNYEESRIYISVVKDF
ncbi:TIGR03016 family PEP-CTERM system-associated outer membrane protein [Thalassotalea sp. LPB0316]|uniref:TIGR03016 family PEP-CTERM system-associated outer membrane protein n=1 Tax=Thalassotalea sp. LPB0316 TaxID=2769490 RepID=UPI001866DC45|nr:TIGR03016 family PEP-CTERM system-associated outer membrane protein [Thalassotalea sp. LPB0316]QOL26489.1 TIGR03016 family PEP-CTERM system-associated outer membrane protein [Thalassotalea sp. LPB0316]